MSDLNGDDNETDLSIVGAISGAAINHAGDAIPGPAGTIAGIAIEAASQGSDGDITANDVGQGVAG